MAPFQILGTSLPGTQEEQNKLTDIEFIHLKNAKFCGANTLMPLNKSYWRGRLSHINGYWLGELFSDN